MISRSLLGHGRKRLLATISIALVAGLGLLPSQATALSAGRIQVNSYLNEPFRASVMLSSLQPGEIQRLQNENVRLADDTSYAALGVEKSQFLTSLKFKVREGSEPGTAIVAISSRQVAKEPFFSFLLEFDGLGGRLIREYTVLLDPNTGQRRAKPASATSSAARPPVPVTIAPATPMPAEQPATRAPTVAESRPVPETERFERQRPPAQIQSQDVYGPVKAGESLWQIAVNLRPDASLSVNQVMWALYSSNPEQFNGNLNLVRRGATLSVPSVGLMRDVSQSEAAALVAEESQRYQLQRQQASAATSSVVVREPLPAEYQVEDVEALQLETAMSEPALADIGDATSSESMVIDEAELQSMQDMPEEELPVLPEVPEPAAEPVELVDEMEELPADDLPALPSEPEMADLADAGGDNFSDLPPLPADDADDSGFDTEALQPLEEESGSSWLSIILGLVSIIVIAGLVLLGLRRKSSADDSAARTAPVSDYAATDVSVSAPRPVAKEDPDLLATDVATKEFPVSEATAATAMPQGVETLDMGSDSTAASADLHDETDFELPDLDTLAEQDDAAGTVEMGDTSIFEPVDSQRVEFGDTEVSEQPAAAAADATAELELEATQDDFGDGTDVLDLGSDTVSLELNEDPVSEADFQLAYGLYDEAALLLNRAIDNDPERLELHEKLAETYFAAGSPSSFKDAASALKQRNPDADTWQRIAIMGQQLCPDDALFAGGLEAGDAAVDLDMDFEAVDETDAATDLSLDMPDEPVAEASTDSADDSNVIEFELDEEPVAIPAAETSAGTVAPEFELSAGDDDFDADFGSLELDAEPEVDEGSVDLAALELEDLESDLELDDPELSAASAEEAADAEFSGDTVVMEALEPEAPEPVPETETAESESEDFGELTLSDISDTDLGLDDALDAGDVLGEDTEFELEDISDSDEPSLETADAADDLSLDDLELEEPAEVESAGAADELSLDLLDEGGDDGLSLDMSMAEAEETDFDLGELAAESTDFDLDASAELPGTAEETDFDLGELASDELGSETDFDLGESDADAGGDALELGDLSLDAASDDTDLGENELELGLSGDDTDFDLGDVGLETDLDLGEGSDASDISGGDEAATKLDLARAYAEMPDEQDMARNLLGEVLQVGSDEQKAEAQELLDKL